MKTIGRRVKTAMCTTAAKLLRSKSRDIDKYRRYAEAKAKIPKDLSAREYEAAVKRLAKIFKI
jgi:hypothetical protein